MRALCCVVAALAVLVVPAVAAADSHEDLIQELEALGEKIEKAMMEDDAEAMLAMYTEDAISLPNFGPRMDGVEAFREHHAQMTGAGMKILEFESQPTDAWKAGDQVIEIGTFEIKLKMPGMEDPVEDKGKYMTVWVRDADGNLKVKAETWNTDTDPMAMMGGGEHMEHGEHMEPHEGDMEHDEGDMEGDHAGDDGHGH